MRYILILSLFLTMTAVVGSDLQIEKSITGQVLPETTYKFRFKLKVNEIMVMQRYRLVEFDVDCSTAKNSHDIAVLVKNTLISNFRLQERYFRDIKFSFRGAPEPDLTRHLQRPGDIVPITCIPTCELYTSDYPEKKECNGKHNNWGPFYMTQNPDGTFGLHQEF